ncbi:MAG: SWIM zinc finger family protein [Bacteroidetes bacterium]|nr:SWIM zinc finger family protein [Bacteroidota bacterium]
MDLKNIKKQIPSEILHRGYQYYTNRQVVSLEENEPGLWDAVVSGNEDYNVTVEIENGELKYWDCDCPYEDGICKHVAAVVYAIPEIKEPEIEATNKNEKRKKTGDIDTIFSKATKEELQEFIVSRFRRDGNLKNAFTAHFSEYIDSDADGKYSKLVKNMISAAEDRYGFVDYRSTRSLAMNLNGLLNKAKLLLEKRNLMESLSIVKTFIEEVPMLVQHEDDSAGDARNIFDYAFEIFSLIVTKAPPQLKDVLFQYCLDEYPKQKYHDNSFEDGFLYILPALISTDEHEKKFLEMIDKQVEVEKTKQFGEYGVSSLLKLKFDFLSERNLKEEARKIAEENKQYPEMMNILINEKIKSKDYIKAVGLCFEGIRIAEEKRHTGTVKDWKEKLLSVYELTNNVTEIRKVAENLFFEHLYEMKYYKKLKSTYPPEEWNGVSESIIDKVKNRREVGSYSDAEILAKIFVEENYKERLLNLMEINKGHIHFVDEYAKYLSIEYPGKILEYYEGGVRAIAKNAGRNFYNEIAQYLKKMKKIIGGEDKVKEIIFNFQNTYKNRKAMMEILSKIK